MRVVIIVNPISGRRGLDGLVTEIRDSLRSQGLDVDTRPTAHAGHAIVLAREVSDATHAVLVVGGDGTLREVAEGLAGRKVPIVVVPAGTENIVGRELGMRPWARQIVETVLRGRRLVCDAGEANGRCFLIIGGIGIDAAVATQLAGERTGHISYLSYMLPGWRVFRSYDYPAISVEVDGALLFKGRGLVFVGVMSRYSMGLRILRDAVWDDGLLDVCILRCASRGELLMHAARIAVGRHIEHSSVIYLRGTRIRVSSAERVPVEIDGEAAGELPADFSIRPGAVTLLAPAGRRIRGMRG